MAAGSPPAPPDPQTNNKNEERANNKSHVWKCFTFEADEEGNMDEQKPVCKRCFHIFKMKGGNTFFFFFFLNLKLNAFDVLGY